MTSKDFKFPIIRMWCFFSIHLVSRSANCSNFTRTCWKESFISESGEPKIMTRRPHINTWYILWIWKTCSQIKFHNTTWKASKFSWSVFSCIRAKNWHLIFFNTPWKRQKTTGGIEMEQISIFSPSTGKWGPEKLPIRTNLTQCSIACIAFFIRPQKKR